MTMTEPRAGLKRGYYLLNTDGGMASNGRRRSGDPLGREAIGPATQNVAEYRALIEGLTLARDYGIQRIRVYMDSELVVDQVNGVSAVRKEHLGELHTVASGLVALFESIRISWVPREMNAEADRLVKDALSALD